MALVRNRDISIDIMKCLAVILVMNSHMDLLYGKYSALATGGAIGDVLFFFASGYTNLLGRGGNFFNWYKRRINRIYPTVFAMAIISAFFLGSKANMQDVIFHGGGMFVTCIMLYYVVFWFAKRFFINHLPYFFAFSSVVVLVWYIFFFEDKERVWMYKGTYFKWCHYFLFMLLGAIIGLRKKNEQNKFATPKLGKTLVGLCSCIVLWYGIQYVGTKNVFVAYCQIVTLLPLLGITYFFYRLCNTQQIQKLYNNRWLHRPMYWISAICLEVYICQDFFHTDRFNDWFPLNVVGCFFVIWAVAYGLKVLSNCFAQTFKDMDYDWKTMVTL